MAKIRRILLECTHTYESDLNTGIQRVVRNIVKESNQICKEIGIECQLTIVKLNRFWVVDRIKNKASLHYKVKFFLKSIYRNVRLFLQTVLPFRIIDRFLISVSDRLRLTSILDVVLCILLPPLGLLMYFQKKLTPREGDLLLLLDSSWVYPIWPAVKHVRGKGTKVGLIVHDIFQVTHPHLFVPAMVERFQRWLDQAINNVDFFIANSQTTRDEVKRYVKSRFPSKEPVLLCESFQLGSVIDNVVSKGRIRSGLKRIFEVDSKHNTYLTVGTIEPRKNHNYLIDAFDKIWRQCHDVKLCIVGQIGWFCDGLKKRIEFHPKYKNCLFMFNDLSDTELDYCYHHAKALVFPSLVEGFGLPLVEALYKDLPVLASDIPVFREVGKDFCTYFDIDHPASLAEIVINIEKEGKMPEVHPAIQCLLQTWESSCRELLNKATALCEKS